MANHTKIYRENNELSQEEVLKTISEINSELFNNLLEVKVEKNVFVFEDPKDANEFYNYINTKFQLNDYYVDVQVPFEVKGKTYFFSFYEVEIPTKTINLIPFVVDGILDQAADMDPIFEEVYTTRTGNWYIAMEVFSDTEKDCLKEGSVSRDIVLPYLRYLKNEYMATDNYNEVVFKN